MDESYFKKIMATIIIIVLAVLSFFLLRPILLSIIFGIIFAFVFSPVHNRLYKKVKSKDLSVVLISLFLIALIILPIWFFTPIMIDQSLKIYFATQKLDFVTPLQTFFPSVFASEEFSREVGSILYSFVNNSANAFVNSLASIILSFPSLFLQLIVAFFTFYFVMRDRDKLIAYVKSLLPFSKHVEKQLFEQTKGITMSILYGQVLIGMIQGIITGIGFFIFSVPNYLFLTLLAVIAGVFPIVGTTIIWVPVAIYLLVTGNTVAAIGVTLFGLVAVFIDNILKPIFVSSRTSMPTSIILIGMIGGFFLFGILGFILGPLILAYLIIILEVYRNKRIPGILVQEPPYKLRISI